MDKVIGLDIGTKRIGIAMSDALGMIAHPVETIAREPEAEALNKIMKLADDNGVKIIAAGLPKNMNGTLGAQAEDCIKFTDKLKCRYEIVFEDERLTSRQAEQILMQTGRKYTKDKQLVDLKSACLILQQYLDRKD